MTPTQRKAMEQALEALKHGVTQLNGIGIPLESDPLHAAITALRAALAEQPAESVQTHAEELAKLGWQYSECPACGSECARAFPQPTKQPLTDEEIRRMWEPHYSDPWADYKDFARAIEAAHGIGEQK